MNFKGSIRHISKLIEVGKPDKKTTKKVLCLEELGDHEHPNTLAIDFIGDKTELLDGLQEGDQVEVLFNTRYNRYGEEANESIFNSIRGWKLNVIKKANGTLESNGSQENDDLPF